LPQDATGTASAGLEGEWLVMRRRKRLGEILVDLEVLTPAALHSVLEALHRRLHRPKFGQVARAMGLVREEEILAALAVQMNLFPGVRSLTLPQILRLLRTPGPNPTGQGT
jgi:hypothetical protein